MLEVVRGGGAHGASSVLDPRAARGFVETGRRSRLSGQRQRRLLAALLLQPNRVVSTEQLADAVWATEPPATARTALQVHISQLRKLRRTRTRSRRTRAATSSALDPEQIDAARFERLLREARAADEAPQAAELLREALALVRGPALADLADETFARPEAVRLDELCVAALEERIEADLASGLARGADRRAGGARRRASAARAAARAPDAGPVPERPPGGRARRLP